MKKLFAWALIGVLPALVFLLNQRAAWGQSGRSLYNDKCTLCHGIRGDGKGPAGSTLSPPTTDFTNPGYWQTTNDRKMTDAINNGVGAMPAFDLNPQEVRALISYIKTFKR